MQNLQNENLTKLPIAYIGHLLLISAIVLLTCWEMADIYVEGSRWFPVLKSSVMALLVIYFNIYVLAPQLLLKKRWYWIYLLVVLYIALIVYFVDIWLNNAVYLKYTLKIRELYGKIDINPLLQMFISVFSLVILMLSSSVAVLFRKWATYNTRVNDLENSVIQSELEQLRKQINPDFLIRLLDKTNAMSLLGNREEASAMLLQLGNILRYQLYDSRREYVLLSSDIRFLTEILSLEQKCRNNFSFTVESEGNLYSYLISPLLFLPFVEQVISTNGNISFINLHFSLNDNALIFECKSPGNAGENMEGEFDAICRRLTLLYENGYSLKVKNENNMQVIYLYISRPKTLLPNRETA